MLAATIRCVAPDGGRVQRDDCYDLALDVAGLVSLEDSLDRYLGRDDQNDGKREFVRLPPVLHLHLKRFASDRSTKINTRFSFPASLDASRWYTDRHVYDLVGVLVHSGSVHSGHYYAYLRAGPELTWHKFNDSVVTAATPEEAIEGNFGQDGSADCDWSAYFLVYVAQMRMDQVFAAVEDTDIPPAVALSLANADGGAMESANLTRLVFVDTIEANARLLQLSVRPGDSVRPTFPFRPEWTGERMYREVESFMKASNFILHPIGGNELAPPLMPDSVSLDRRPGLCDAFFVVSVPSGWTWDGELIAQCVTLILVIVMGYFSSLASPLHFAELTHVQDADRVASLFPDFRRRFGIEAREPIRAFGFANDTVFELTADDQFRSVCALGAGESFSAKPRVLTIVLQTTGVEHDPDELAFLEVEDDSPEALRSSPPVAIFCADPPWPAVFPDFYTFRSNTAPVQVACLTSRECQLFTVPETLPGVAFVAFVARHFCPKYDPLNDSVIAFLGDNKRQLVFDDGPVSQCLGAWENAPDPFDLKIAVYSCLAEALLGDLLFLKITRPWDQNTRDLVLFPGHLTIEDLICQCVGRSDAGKCRMAAITGEGTGTILPSSTIIWDEVVPVSLMLEREAADVE
jgi:hypothetical protein